MSDNRRFDVLYSGIGECALLTDQETGDKFVIRNLDDTEPVSADGVHIGMLTQDVTGWQKASGVTAAEAYQLVLGEYNYFTALWLVDLILNPEKDDDMRQSAAIDLEELLSDEMYLARVRNVLWSIPLPEVDGISMDARFPASFSPECPLVGQLLAELQRDQPEIARVRAVWNQLPDELFGAEGKVPGEKQAVSLGLFRLLVCRSLNSLVQKPEFILEIQQSDVLGGIIAHMMELLAEEK